MSKLLLLFITSTVMSQPYTRIVVQHTHEAMFKTQCYNGRCNPYYSPYVQPQNPQPYNPPIQVRTIAYGSGTFITKSHVLSCYHVFSEYDKSKGDTIYVQIPGKQFKGELLDIDQQADLALIEIATEAEINPILIALTHDFSTHNTYHSHQYQEGGTTLINLQGNYHSSFAPSSLPNGLINEGSKLFNFPTRHGGSGAGLLNNNQSNTPLLVGVIWGCTEPNDATGLSVATPLSAILRFLKNQPNIYNIAVFNPQSNNLQINSNNPNPPTWEPMNNSPMNNSPMNNSPMNNSPMNNNPMNNNPMNNSPNVNNNNPNVNNNPNNITIQLIDNRLLQIENKINQLKPYDDSKILSSVEDINNRLDDINKRLLKLEQEPSINNKLESYNKIINDNFKVMDDKIKIIDNKINDNVKQDNVKQDKNPCDKESRELAEMLLLFIEASK